MQVEFLLYKGTKAGPMNPYLCAPMSKKHSGQSGNQMSFLQHLEVLRWHLVRSAAAILLMAIVAFLNKELLFDVIIFGPKSPDFITYLKFCEWSRNLGINEIFCFQEMPFSLLNTTMAGQFSMHIWVSIISGVILAFPYVVWEFWKFLKPGLHPHERKLGKGVMFFTTLLFLTGVLFGYYLIVPLSVQFLGTYTVSAEVNNLIDLGSYISLVSSVTLACGLLFELPIVVYFLSKMGILTPQWMRQYRRHALVVVLIVSAIITPPDVTSQVLVAVPVLLLYEISILLSAAVVRGAEKRKLRESKSTEA